MHLLAQAGLIRAIPAAFDGRATLYAINPVSHGRITAWLAGTEVGLDGRE